MDDAVGPEVSTETGPSGSEQAGFTLVELLVAVAVLAVLAVGASLAATRRAGGEDDAQRFAQSYATARQLAVQGQEMRGLEITPRGSRTTRHADGTWDDTAREEPWRGRVAFAQQGADLPADLPEIVFLPNGRTSAFTIRFGGAGGQVCTSDGWTGLTCAGG